MKMGTIVSPWHYDVVADQALELDNIPRTAISLPKVLSLSELVLCA
jgi:hypothetical protein